MTTIAQVTPSIVCQKHHITPEQLSAGTHVVLNGTQHCVIVESASVPGQEYKIIFNSEYKVLQCTAHNGEACKASASGKQCYHKRVALAVLELERVESRRKQEAKRQREQVTCLTGSNGQRYYQVDNYTIKYSRDHGKIVCSCPIGKLYGDCPHYRLAQQAELAQRQAEQAQIEATAEYQLDQLFRELDDALDNLDRIAAESDRKEQARRDAERSAYNNFCLSMGI